MIDAPQHGRRLLSYRRLRIVMGLVLIAGLAGQALRAQVKQSEEASSPVIVHQPGKPSPSAALASAIACTSEVAETIEESARRNPVAFLEGALERYDRSVRDYTCTFTKQELIHQRLSKKQVMNVMFREKPFSVRMEWIKNRDKCSRVLYVADRWVEDGRQMAVIEPGPIAKLFVSYVMRPIHGKDAKKSSRRTIDQFGARNSLLLILKYCKLAEEQGILDIKYVGNGEVDGRETIVFERHLPYTGNEEEWPDRVLVAHIDRELLFPVLCQSFADDDKTQLLGSYMTTNIQLNANLSESFHTKQGMGL